MFLEVANRLINFQRYKGVERAQTVETSRKDRSLAIYDCVCILFTDDSRECIPIVDIQNVDKEIARLTHFGNDSNNLKPLPLPIAAGLMYINDINSIRNECRTNRYIPIVYTGRKYNIFNRDSIEECEDRYNSLKKLCQTYV